MKFFGLQFALLLLMFLDGCSFSHYQTSKRTQPKQEPAKSMYQPKSLVRHKIQPSAQITDKASVTAKEYSLDQVIQTTLKSDPQIAAAFENISQAEADLLTAGLLPNPQIITDIQLLPLNRSFTVDRQGGPPQFDFIVAMPVDWFIFGKRVAAMVSARKTIDIAAADYANTVRLRISDAIAYFYDALEAQALLELANENKESLNKMEQIILNRVSLGGVGTIEADRIKLSIFSNLREVRTQELALSASINKLRAIMGIADNVPIKLKGDLDVDEPAKPMATEAAFALAEENRPDLISLKEQIELANSNITLQERRAYPQITPSVGYTRQFQQQAIGYPDANSWLAGLNVNIPLFDRNQGNIAKAKSMQVQSQFNFEAQLVTIRAEIEQALQAFASASQFLSQDDLSQLEAADKVREKITQAYELGGKTLIEVLDAQRAYLETYRVHINGRSNYWHSLYQLNSVIGKQVLQ